jgi:ribosomal protein S18 acetylase RimI-like enzyme
MKADTITSVQFIDDEDFRQIMDMERELFPEALWDCENYEQKMEGGKITIIAYAPDGKVAGYIFAVPHGEAYDDLKEVDSRMSPMQNAIYLESIAIRSEYQGRGYFSKLVKKLIEEVSGRPITMHARVSNNCSVGMQKQGAVLDHSVENWFDSGERFDYLIIPGTKKE